jgi:hypothetical protein
LGLAGGVDDSRCGVVGDFRARRGPHDFAGFTIHPRDRPAAAMIRGNEDERFVDDRGGAKALVRDVVAYFLLPQQFAVARKGAGMHRATVKKVDVKIITIASDGGGSRAGIVVVTFISAQRVDFGLPEKFSVGVIEADDGLGPFLFVSSGEEDLVANNGRRAMAATGN